MHASAQNQITVTEALLLVWIETGDYLEAKALYLKG